MAALYALDRQIVQRTMVDKLEREYVFEGIACV